MWLLLISYFTQHTQFRYKMMSDYGRPPANNTVRLPKSPRLASRAIHMLDINYTNLHSLAFWIVLQYHESWPHYHQHTNRIRSTHGIVQVCTNHPVGIVVQMLRPIVCYWSILRHFAVAIDMMLMVMAGFHWRLWLCFVFVVVVELLVKMLLGLIEFWEKIWVNI